jgi:hypothetical protein
MLEVMMNERSRSIENGNRGRVARKIAAAAGGVAALAMLAGCDTMNGPIHKVKNNPTLASPIATHKPAPPTIITFTTEVFAFHGIRDTNEDMAPVIQYADGGKVDVVCEVTGREYEDKHDGRTSDMWLELDTTHNPYVSVLDGTLTSQPPACSGYTQ